jgi:hypothetical protein
MVAGPSIGFFVHGAAFRAFHKEPNVSKGKYGHCRLLWKTTWNIISSHGIMNFCLVYIPKTFG